MFIPFCIDPANNGSRHQVLMGLVKQYGIIFYRLRLPYYALIGFTSGKDCPRKKEHKKITEFVVRLLGKQFAQTVACD